jgi:aspartyl-tRNA(Asn)/glutamyl-tRNA(Gln) amidotransferase subunit C
MPLDKAAVDHVARLARLALTDEEQTRMQTELTQILSHAEKIQSLDLDAVEPTSHAVPIVNALRPDAVTESLSPDVALANAPEVEAGRFRVPRIIEDQG